MEITCKELINYIEENGVPSEYGNGDIIYNLDEPYRIIYNVDKEELCLYKNGINVKEILKDIMAITGLSRFNNIYSMIDYYDDLYQKKQEEENKKQEAVKAFLGE